MNFNLLFLILISIFSLTLQNNRNICSKKYDRCKSDCNKKTYKFKVQCKKVCFKSFEKCKMNK